MLGVDLETSGVKPLIDKPVQACLVLRDGGADRIVMNTLVNPGRPIPKEASDIHGITSEQVASAPDYVLVAWNISLLYREIQPTYIVGYNSRGYDEVMLDTCFGSPVFPDANHIDVMEIARRYFPTEENHKLGTLYWKFLGKPLEGAHDASVDVIGTLDLLEALRIKLGMSLEELAADMAVPRPWTLMPFGKFKGELLENVEPGWARWLKGQNPDMKGDLKASVDLILGVA